MAAAGIRTIPRVIFVLAVLIAVYEWAVAVSAAIAPGAIGPDFHGIGTDWMVFHAAARRFLAGDLAQLYDGATFTARLNADYAAWLFDRLDYRPWVNPPWFLLAMAPLGMLPFALSYLAGQVLQLALLGTVLRQVRGAAGPLAPAVVLACLLSPAAAFNAAAGQTALLTGALCVTVLLQAERRPWLAGLALALLTFKPQVGPVLVVYLLAAGRWEVIGWAAVAGAGLIAASAALVGTGPWLDWFEVIRQGLSGSGQWNDAGRLWGNSVYTCLFAAGVPAALASAGQLVASVGSLVAAAVIARRDPDPHRRAGAVLLLVLLGAPYFAAYDTILAVLALALAWGTAPDRAPGRLTGWLIPLLVWMLPFVSPPLLNPLGRLTPLILLAALVQLYHQPRRTGDLEQAAPIG